MALTFREDGWFNMTKAAKAFGKRLDSFWVSPETAAYVAELQRLGKESHESWDFSKDLVVPVRGYNGGTWAHPKLAVFFARWLDVRFGVWCDRIIKDILKGNAELVITKPAESAVMALPTDYLSALKELVGSLECRRCIRFEPCPRWPQF